jgi:hypothetical protein
VENINSLDLLNKSFKKKKEYRIEDQFKNSFEYWGSDEKYSVSLLFSKDVSSQILNGLWSEDQEIEVMDDGKVRLKIIVNSIEQVGDWVLTWGKDVLIEEPQRLKIYVLSLAKGILSSNSDKFKE